MTTKKEIIEAIDRLEDAILKEFDLLQQKEIVETELIKVHYEVLQARENLRSLDY
jgi:hypothetical protein